LSFLITISE